MSGMKKFERDSISLASRKVAAATGDARRALDICWKAIEVAERDEKKSVGMSEVNKAVQEMFTSPMILAVKLVSGRERGREKEREREREGEREREKEREREREREREKIIFNFYFRNLSLKQKLFLQSILNEFKFTGIEETTFLAVS